MSRFLKCSFPLVLLTLLFLTSCSNSDPEVKLHYLGHSSIFLDFDGDVTVLCDYGKENAYLEWGWDSPIYDAGEPGPDIISYSHTHDDHFDEERAKAYDAVRIHGDIDTTFKKLQITSFNSSEKDISRYDNHSYLFTYKDIEILHLGDCQADIMMINDPAHTGNIEKRYPKGCDILIMPIEGTQQYILQAIKMVDLLEPKVLVPTHYWSSEYKHEFLNKIKSSYEKKNITLKIDNMGGAEYSYHATSPENTLTILNLTPSARHSK